MSKTYKIKVNQGQGEAKFVDIPQTSAFGKPFAVKAVIGGKYQLLDASTGYAPENIRANRSGKNLQVFFEGRNTPDLVIEDYYEVTPEGFNGLIGEAETGRLYEYIPESAAGSTSVPLLSDGAQQVGMALGGAEIQASGAAVGALVAVAGLNPVLLAPLALLGAGGGGAKGGSAGAVDTTPPAIKSAKLHVDDDSGAKDNVTNDKTPRIEVQTEPNATVSVEINGKPNPYVGKADSNGLAVIQIPDADKLDDGTYTPKVTATNAAGNKTTVDGTPFTIDTQGPGDKGLSIVSMSVDSGLGSFNPLDASRKDFKTNDTTPEFKGQLQTALNPGEWIEIQLLSKADGQMIDSALIKADASNTNWTWGSSKVLADGDYVVQARIVDAAGNGSVQPGTTTLVAPVKQDVVIDTQGANDNKDSNKGLKISAINISEDTGAQGINSDFVTFDGGDKDGIPSNADDSLSFSGQLNTSFSQNGGKIFVQIVGANGKAVSSAYVEPTNNTWSYEHIGKLAEGQYVAKTILMDHVGNMISAKDQSFFIDKTDSVVTKFGSESLVNNAMEYKDYYLVMNEYGTYQLGNGSIKTYTGGKLDLGALAPEYATGAFSLKFWDQTGNLTTYKNDTHVWKFINQDTSPSSQVGSLIARDFTGTQTMGSVGQYQVASNLDMASLYDGIDNMADQAAINHVVLSNTANVTLNLSMGDVLALGVTNSFSVADVPEARHQGQIQMRVDGQSGDVLNLDGWVNGSQLAWSGGQNSTNSPLGIGAEQYSVYTNASLGLVLFVDTDITVKVF